MGKPDEVTRDMLITMAVYGIVIQIICIFLPGDLLKMSCGLWIGVATGAGMLIHMKNSLIEALDLGEAGAKKYMQKSYMKRYIVVVVVFIAVAFLDVANVLTLLAGVMGLKVSAYLQPVLQKVLKKNK